MDDVLMQTGDLSGKVIVTCSLPMNDDNTGLVIAHSPSGAEVIAKKIPKAQVVSAFNTVPNEVLFGVYKARRKAARPSLVYCGDDSSSKGIAAELIRDAGFDPVDAGPYGLPVIPSRLHCSLASLHTEEEMGRNWRTGSSDLKNRLGALGNAAAARKNMTEGSFWREDALHSPTLPALKRTYDYSY